MTTSICDAFRQNPNIDPETGAPLYLGTRRWLQLSQLCGGAEITLPTVPTPGQLPTVPTPGRLPTVPIPGQLPTVPTPGRLPTVPIPGQLPTVPTPGRLPTVPIPGQLPTVPIPGQLPTNLGQLPTVPIPGQLPTVPIPGQLPATLEAALPIRTGPEIPAAQTPAAIELLNRLYPNHMTVPQNHTQVDILHRRRFLKKYIVHENEDELGLIITPHKIILNPRHPDILITRNPNSLNFRSDDPYIIELHGPWIITPLDDFPDGRSGGVIARLPYRLFPRIRIGSNWAHIIVNSPVVYPGNQIGLNGYIIQENPSPDEFQFTTTDYNSAFFQASIETSRSVHPSLETMIQAAEAIDVFPELRNRNQFGSYLRDATFFEVNRIYKGSRAEAARKFMLFMDQAKIPQREITDRYRYDLIPFTVDQMRALERFMEERGYRWTYLGFVNINHPAGRARFFPTVTLTRENFPESITPDQAILMDAWRDKVLHTGATTQPLKNLLGFRDIAQTTGYYTAPVLANIGFLSDDFRQENRLLRLRVNDIRNPGEPAVSQHGRDISQKHVLSFGSGMCKSYYTMLYYEAMRRNLLPLTNH